MFMIVYIKFATFIPCAVVVVLVTYEFATEQSLCCKSLSSRKASDTDFIYTHRGILKAFAMGVTNLCIMGKGKFGVDENFYRVAALLAVNWYCARKDGLNRSDLFLLSSNSSTIFFFFVSWLFLARISTHSTLWHFIRCGLGYKRQCLYSGGCTHVIRMLIQ